MRKLLRAAGAGGLGSMTEFWKRIVGSEVAGTATTGAVGGGAVARVCWR